MGSLGKINLELARESLTYPHALVSDGISFLSYLLLFQAPSSGALPAEVRRSLR